MKQLILLLTLFLSSCFPMDSPRPQEVNPVEDVRNLKLITWDSCQWVQYTTKGGYRELTHRGRCIYYAQRAKPYQSATWQVSRDGKNWETYTPKSIDHE